MELPAISPIPIGERVGAVVETGWVGMGLAQDDLRHLRDTIGFTALRGIIADAGMTYTEIELLEHWWIPRHEEGHSYGTRELLFDAADALAPTHIKIGSRPGEALTSLAPLVDPLRRLADEAAEHGTKIAIEPMPFSAISTIPMGAELVRQAGRPNLGVIVDAWHVFRAGTTFDELRSSLTAEMIIGVELNDADPTVIGSLFEDTVLRRRYPGDGCFDLTGLVSTLREIGYDGTWGVEMLSEDYRRLPYREALSEAYRSATAFVDG
ncbi:sugar phosphate isomerase [Rhodococcoides trifolii]|uniref:Sugar phosphate isomerase n=2 Tax=Rhodococcoides trifolii TaxID=908250 RepID=A0A917D681_9NOCA|nr:sugar phosphate isomerase [Rhodococcus trifolii]